MCILNRRRKGRRFHAGVTLRVLSLVSANDAVVTSGHLTSASRRYFLENFIVVAVVAAVERKSVEETLGAVEGEVVVFRCKT